MTGYKISVEHSGTILDEEYLTMNGDDFDEIDRWIDETIASLVNFYSKHIVGLTIRVEGF